MKNRKSFLSLGIIVLVLFLGVGYAVVSSVYLNIGGTASVANADLKVEITNAVASTNVSGKAVDFTHQLSNKNLDSSFTLNGLELDETVSITYTVTNNETDVDAELSLASGVELTNSNVDFFDVGYEITDNVTDLANGDKIMTVVVTVKLIQTPVTEEEGVTTVGLKLVAIPKGGSENSGSSSTTTSPVKFGEQYTLVTAMDIDVRNQGAWIKFYEDGHIEQSDDFSAAGVVNEGYSYTNTNISYTDMPDEENITVSSDGKFITAYSGTRVRAAYVLDTEYTTFSTNPLRFGEEYVCTTDNLNAEEDSIVNSYVTFYPDGSAKMIYSNRDPEEVPAGSLVYTQTEIQGSGVPENQRLLISEDGKTLTQMVGETIGFVYTLSTPVPLSWNTAEVVSNTSVVIDNSVISDLPQTNPAFVKISDSTFNWLYLVNTAIYVDGKDDLVYDSVDYTNYASLVKYSNGTDNFYVILIYSSGTYFGSEFAERGIYVYNASGYDSTINQDMLIDHTK